MRLLAWTLVGCSAGAEPPAARAAREVVVLPLGDSITEGVPTEDGYRGFLRDALAARGVRVRFVGTRASAAGAHEGWSGWTADELGARVEPAVRAGAPDFVLLHAGTNDIGLGQAGAAVARDVARLLARIHGAAPRAHVLLARIVPMARAGAGVEAEVGRLSAALDGVAAERRRTGQRVTLVDAHRAIDVRRDMHDELHPNASGYRKLAAVWADAIARATGGP